MVPRRSRPRAVALAACAQLAAACTVNIDATGGRFSCVGDRDCPLDTTCDVAAHVCVTDQPVADAAPVSADAACAVSYTQAVLDDQPILYYRMHDTSSPLTDELGNHPGSFNPADVVTGVAGGLVGDADPAIEFAAPAYSNARFEDVSWEGDFTVETLVRPLAFNGIAGGIFITEEYQVSGFRLAIEDSNSLLRLWCNESGCTEPTLFSTAAVPTGAWSHVVLTRESGTFRVYLDGALEIEGAFPSLVTPTPGGWFGPAQGLRMSAQYDECAVYDHALSAARVAHHATLAREGMVCP